MLNSQPIAFMEAPMDTFTEAYVECALWSSTDDDGEPLGDNYGAEDIAPETLAAMVEDCRQFQESNAALLAEAYETAGYDEGRAGHDFWLTRNRHGSGFWDHGLGDIGTKLTDDAHAWGSIDLYVGDDGQVHA
jgi:hypothetical protein